MIYNKIISLLSIHKTKHGTFWCYTWRNKILANVCLKLILKIILVNACLKLIPKICSEYSRKKYEMEFLLQSYKMSKEIVILFQI